MQNDDEKFETFLRQFRPCAPQPLRVENRVPAVRRPLLVALAAIAAVLVVTVATINSRHKQRLPRRGFQVVASLERLSNPQLLTIGKANALLAQAPSVKVAVDGMAFKSQPAPLPKGQHSALTVLGKEN